MSTIKVGDKVWKSGYPATVRMIYSATGPLAGLAEVTLERGDAVVPVEDLTLRDPQTQMEL